MKKIIFLIVGLLYGITSFAQHVNLNNAVSVNIPKGLQKVSRQQALEHARKKFKGNKMIANFYADSTIRGERLYKIDDIIIELITLDTTFNFKAGHAAELKKGMDEMARKVPSYTSSLEKINNYSVVITNSIIGNIGYCYFYCFNISNTRIISGRLIFDKAQKDKATAILNQILNSIKFKD